MTKRILSMLLCLVMVFSLLPAFSIEAEAASYSYNELRAAAEAASKMTWYWPISEGKGSVTSAYGFRDGSDVSDRYGCKNTYNERWRRRSLCGNKT